GEQSFKPASLSTGFHSHPHACPLRRQIAIKLLRFLAMLQSPLLHFPGFGIHPCNLLESRVVVTTYNHHCSAPFSRTLVGWHHQSLLGRRSRHCYGINCAQNRAGANPPHFAATPDSAAATGR